MRIAAAVASSLLCACAAHAPAPAPAVAARTAQLEAMRRAPLVASRSYAQVEGCLLRQEIVRSLTPSSLCLACHDGSVTTATPTRADDTHRVSVDYESARAAGIPLVPTADTPRAIVFVAGKVECTTCHDPASTLPHATAMPLGRSALCLGCHPR
jgi:predicted CXXCH cytochrome family protein